MGVFCLFNPLHIKKEQQDDYSHKKSGRKLKLGNQLSAPHHMIEKLEKTQSIASQNKEQT